MVHCRTMEAGLVLSRPPEAIGRYKMVRHHKSWQADGGYDLFMTWQSRWQDDGLINVHQKYEVSRYIFHNISSDVWIVSFCILSYFIYFDLSITL